MPHRWLTRLTGWLAGSWPGADGLLAGSWPGAGWLLAGCWLTADCGAAEQAALAAVVPKPVYKGNPRLEDALPNPCAHMLKQTTLSVLVRAPINTACL